MHADYKQNMNNVLNVCTKWVKKLCYTQISSYLDRKSYKDTIYITIHLNWLIIYYY